MKKYVITIEELISQNFVVEANDAEEAMEIAEKKYNNNEFILESGNLVTKQMAITEPENEATEWCEFQEAL